LLLDDEADILRGEIHLIVNKTTFTDKVDFEKTDGKIGQASLYTCRYNDPTLIWDQIGKKKFGKKNRFTKLKQHESYKIEILCKTQNHSVSFHLD